MRVLVTWGSKRGGTEGIGRMIGDALQAQGHDVTMVSAESVRGLDRFDAVIVGGALYANRWPGNVRRFVQRNVNRLREVPVWFFSSGPLDDSADRQEIPAVRQVTSLAQLVGARDHVTFGGMLAPDAHGIASAMAKTNAGDWRNPTRIRAWAAQLGEELPTAKPGQFIEPQGRSVPRLVGHALAGWAVCGAILFGIPRLANLDLAVMLHAIAVPLVFMIVAWSYFRAPGARAPLSTAIAFAVISAVLDLAIIALLQTHLALLRSAAATWVPYVMIFLVTWAIGGVMSTLPWLPPEKPAARA